MNVTINGSPTAVPDGATVIEILERLDLPSDARGVAVAVDAEVVPRGQWPRVALYDGARVEIVHAVQGG